VLQPTDYFFTSATACYALATSHAGVLLRRKRGALGGRAGPLRAVFHCAPLYGFRHRAGNERRGLGEYLWGCNNSEWTERLCPAYSTVTTLHFPLLWCFFYVCSLRISVCISRFVRPCVLSLCLLNLILVPFSTHCNRKTPRTSRQTCGA